MRFCFIILVVLFVNLHSFAQKDVDSFYTQDSLSLSKVLKVIEQKHQVKFSYDSELIEGKKVHIKRVQDINLDDLLMDLSLQSGLDFNRLDATYIYIVKSNSQQLNEVYVTSYLTGGIDKQKDGSLVFTPGSLGLLAGIMEADILESIQQLPGVISISETATQLNVRGGTPDQNQIIWDNVNIYHGGHLFGMVSVFNPNVAQKIRFYNKATPVRYGDKISGVIDIKTPDKIPGKTAFQWGINGINTDVYFHTPLIKDQLALQLSFRRSYEDFIETPTFMKYEEKAFQNATINDEFFYFKDYNLNLLYKNKRQSLKFSLLHIDNDFESEYEAGDDEITDFLDTENNAYSLNWHYQLNKNSKIIASIGSSFYRLNYKNSIRFDDDEDDDDERAVFSKKNHIDDYNFFTEYHYQSGKNKKILLGYQLNNKQVSYLFKEEKDILYILDADDRQINTHSFYTSFHLDSPAHFSFDIGLRSNYYQSLNSFKWEPRLIITHQINRKLALQATAELKSQIISQIEETVLNDFHLENKIWRLANPPDFPIITARHLSLGGKYETGKFLLDFDFYHKHIEGISALSLGFLNPTDNRFHNGLQKIDGFEILLQKTDKRFNYWISYSFTDAKNKYNDINNNQYFTANTQIKHSFSINATYKHSGFQTAVNWRIRSGSPLTVLHYDDTGNLIFDHINTERHPVYHRLDFSSTYQFKLSKNTKAKAGISIRNVYNNKTLINTEYYGNNSLNDPIRSLQVYSIGFTPNFMFRVYW